MQETKFNFSATRIANITPLPGKSLTFYKDLQTKGLGLRVSETGEKTYIFESKMYGNTIRISIGDPSTWPLLEAQKRAREFKAMIDKGMDPRKHLKDLMTASKAAKINKAPAMVAWHDYIEKRKHKWGERHLETHHEMARDGTASKKKLGKGDKPGARVLPGILYSILLNPLDEITRECVDEWMRREMVSRPSRTRMAITMLGAFLNWCSDQKPYKALIHRSMLSGLKRELPKQSKRDDCLRRAQISPFMQALRDIKNPIMSAYLQGLLITGARRTELALLKWEDVSFKWNEMTIRDKIEGTRKIPLTPYLKSLIEPLPKVNEYVFSNTENKHGRINDIRKTMIVSNARAEIPYLTPHGLRRSFVTLFEWTSAPNGVAKQIMGHKPSGTTEGHYIVREMDFLYIWHCKYEEFLLTEAGFVLPANK
jgi:integrase